MTGPTAGRVVVVGVGSADRGDDGVGPAVVAALAGRLPPGVAARTLDGEPARLIDAWDGAGLAVVVDATAPTPGRAPGRVDVLDVRPAHGELPVLPEPAVSSHAAGVGTALALARVLDRMPDRLVVVAVSGAGFDLGAPMSPPVRAAVADAADAVLAAVRPAARVSPG